MESLALKAETIPGAVPMMLPLRVKARSFIPLLLFETYSFKRSVSDEKDWAKDWSVLDLDCLPEC